MNYAEMELTATRENLRLHATKLLRIRLAGQRPPENLLMMVAWYNARLKTLEQEIQKCDQAT